MRVNARKITKKIEKLYPLSLADDWDNVGYQIGNINRVVEKVMVCLEVTHQVIDEAVENCVDLIIAHHPLIFHAPQTLAEHHPKASLMVRLIKEQIGLYVMHTNADNANDSLNDMLCQQLALTNIAPLLALEGARAGYALGRIGELPNALNNVQFAALLKEKLSLSAVKMSLPTDKPISRVAIITGAGMDFIDDVAKTGVDAFITGDVRYHETMESRHYGIVIADIGHYESEIVFSQQMAKILAALFEREDYDVIVEASQAERPLFSYL